MTPTLTLGPIPLNIGTRERPTNAPFPDELPFTAQLDERSGVISQAFEPSVAAILDEIYARGSQLGTPMSDYGLGKVTCEDFLAFLHAALSLQDLRGMKVLEVGCGTGYLLARLREVGAEVLGIEPGASSSVHAKSAGIRVIHEPFERVELNDDFDLVLHTGVLEHVRAPVEFLRRQLSLLRPGGGIAFAVPDCEPALAHGDFSMFVHEHWSYFTTASIASLVKAAGGRANLIRSARVGGALYVSADKAGPPARRTPPVAETANALDAFAQRAARGRQALADYFAERCNAAIGVYCPGRFLNYWRLADTARLRLFDDDIALHGRYFPPMPIPIEPRSCLLARPVDSLLIMSRTFGPALASTLRNNPALANCEIVTISELF